MTRAVAEAVRVPVVASGGAGSPEHLFQALTTGQASAALAASIFHYGQYSIFETKRYLAERALEPKRTFDNASQEQYGVVWQFGGCYLGGHLDAIADIQKKYLEAEMLTDEKKRTVWEKNLTRAASELCWENEEEKLFRLYHQALTSDRAFSAEGK
jgi:hypothetical protein